MVHVKMLCFFKINIFNDFTADQHSLNAGMNAAVRAVVRMGMFLGCKVYLIKEVFFQSRFQFRYVLYENITLCIKAYSYQRNNQPKTRQTSNCISSQYNPKKYVNNTETIL